MCILLVLITHVSTCQVTVIWCIVVLQCHGSVCCITKLSKLCTIMHSTCCMFLYCTSFIIILTLSLHAVMFSFPSMLLFSSLYCAAHMAYLSAMLIVYCHESYLTKWYLAKLLTVIRFYAEGQHEVSLLEH